jgi:hypothetical protein
MPAMATPAGIEAMKSRRNMNPLSMRTVNQPNQDDTNIKLVKNFTLHTRTCG